MKVAMVNDCAYVGETILKYLPKDINAEHIKRSRGVWSKTFGIAYNIWKAKADVYHVHYLLQDCYLASVLGKRPLIGHAHGSDLTTTINRFFLGRIVRSNVKKCDKILVSTPDLIEKARQYREDAEYLPNPVDTSLFYPKPSKLHEGKVKVLLPSGSNWAVKGTDVAIRALAQLKDKVEVSIIGYGIDLEKTLMLAKSLGLQVNVLSKVPHKDLNTYYWNADLVVDQFVFGVFGLTSLEAIACGRPVVISVSSKYEVYKNFPLKDVDTLERIIQTIENLSPTLWKAEYDYLMQNHDPKKIAHRVNEIYQEVL